MAKEAKIRSVGDLFRDSYEVFIKNWKKFILFELFSIVLMLLPIVLIILSLGLNVSKYPELKDYMLTNPTNPTQINPGALANLITSVFTSPLFILGFLLLLLSSVLYNLGFYKTVFTAAEGKEATFKENLTYAWKNLLPYLGVSIVMALAVLGGIVLFVIPGLVFAVWFSFFPLVFILGGNHKVAALKESKELVKDYFWPVTGRLLVIYLFSQLISYIFSSQPNRPGNIVFVLIGAVFSLILPGFIAAYLYFMYKDLKAIKK